MNIHSLKQLVQQGKAVILKENGMWEGLAGKKVHTPLAIIRDMKSLSSPNGPKCITTENVIMYDCDKNFVHRWANYVYFKDVKHFYLLSHPCDSVFFSCWHGRGTKVYVADYYKRYVNRWAPNPDDIHILSEEETKQIHSLMTDASTL